jgi:hypothetical protein
MSEYVKKRTKDKYGGPEKTEIYALGKKRPLGDDRFSVGGSGHEEDHQRPFARASFTHAQEETNGEYEYNDDGKPMVRRITKYSPTELFTHRPAQIQELYADPSMAHHVGNLLGAAVNEHRDREHSSTAIPMPDSNLSPYSSKLVKNARAKGIKVPSNPDNPDDSSSNKASYANRTISKEHLYREGFTDMPASEVKGARSTIKEILRESKPSKVSPQQFDEHFSQGKLF